MRWLESGLGLGLGVEAELSLLLPSFLPAYFLALPPSCCSFSFGGLWGVLDRWWLDSSGRSRCNSTVPNAAFSQGRFEWVLLPDLPEPAEASKEIPRYCVLLRGYGDRMTLPTSRPCLH